MIFTDEQLARAGVRIRHHFGDDGSKVYIKETFIPAGVRLPLHSHTFTHKSVLASGRALLRVGGDASRIADLRILTIPQGTQHEIEAETDCTWLCIHATDEADAEYIDMTLVEAA